MNEFITQFKGIPTAVQSFRLTSLISKFIRSFIVKLYYKLTESKDIECKELFSLISSGIISYPNLITYDTTTKTIHSDINIFGVIRYKNKEFLISLIEHDDDSPVYLLYLISDTTNEIYFTELYKKLISEALCSADLGGKVIKIVLLENIHSLTFDIVDSLQQLSLNDIVLPKDTMEDLWDFISAVTDKTGGLRYLFVGNPGTGKTDTMIAIINEILKRTNDIPIFVIQYLRPNYIEYVFQILSNFRNAVICLDDLDLFVQDRRDSFLKTLDLTSFLQLLDGVFANDNLYILATTNSRELLDTALKRPGRFDLIIEFKPPHPDDYIKIVSRETNDEKLLNLFKEETIKKKLASIKATGAFLVTLIKHLKKPRYRENLSVDLTIDVIDKLYNSFKYDMNVKSDIGFE